MTAVSQPGQIFSIAAKGIPVKSDNLTDVDQQRIETIVRQFEVACQALDAGFYPQKIAEPLPDPRHTLHLPVLTRLVLSDMRRRARLGASINLDVYVEHFEELHHTKESMPKLMRTELELRRQAGEEAPMSGYRKRFPEHFAAFRLSCQSLDGTLRVSAPRTEKSQEAGGQQAGQVFVPDFNAYDLVRPIGEGQYGKVWQAVAPGGVDVAVKIVSWPHTHRITQMELRALEAVKRIRHPFLIQMHAYWAMEDQLVMIMELADGSLEERHKECIEAGEIGIPIDELVKYTSEAAEALDHLHCEHVVHRDIKPANILLVKGHAKLGDFGVARLVEREKPDFRATLVGTPLFMAAEVFDHQVSPASDQYSLAAMYLDLRVGLPNSSYSDLMSGKGTLLESLLKLPEPERRVLQKALHQDPNQRFVDCRLMAEALKGATVAEVRPQPTRWVLWLTAAVVLIAGVLAGAYFIRFPPRHLEIIEGFRIAKDFKPVPIHNYDYPDRVFRDLDDLALEFVLICPSGVEDPKDFYIMVDKVSNEAFAKFTHSPDGEGIGHDWEQYSVYEESSENIIQLNATGKDNAKLPVMNISIDEAHLFSKWIHPDARFPTEEEWKKAAGYYDCREDLNRESASWELCGDYPEGPFKGKWGKGTDVAVGNLWRPRKIGISKDDISPFGCRDMAGNGYEFTHSTHSKLEIFESDPIKRPELLNFNLWGMSWDKDDPYVYGTEPATFFYLTDPNPDDAEQKPNRQRDSGFRVVIPIPRIFSFSQDPPKT